MNREPEHRQSACNLIVPTATLLAPNSDGITLVRLESAHLRVEVAPGVGGRVVSLIEKSTGQEFLWRNSALRLACLPAGSEYDPNFFGGIDELIPNDPPETINGVDCPDHGELWTTPLHWEIQGARLRLRGTLPRCGLTYGREISLRPDGPVIDCHYRITNPTPAPRCFLWKLHAALLITPGDVLECPASQGQVVDLAWSRFHTLAPFPWPMIEGQAANVVPPPGHSTDFFYLWSLTEGRMALHRPGQGLRFVYQFDRAVFPYAWLFASYGGFLGHYTAILEPCTTLPMSVNQAAARHQCTVLEPGGTLQTGVAIYAGRD